MAIVPNKWLKDLNSGCPDHKKLQQVCIIISSYHIINSYYNHK